MSSSVKKPDFFIVGAPKCGTTAMADYIGQHPDVFMPQQKDSQFFGSDLNFINSINHPPDKFRVSEAIFLSWYVLAGNEKRLGEASVWYLYSKRAAEEIAAFSPGARIIAMLRNPVDMLYSLHGQFLYELNETLEDFSEALQAEADRRQGRRIPQTAYFPDGLLYRETAKYAEQLERYFDRFGRENVRVILFDEFQKDLATVYRDTLRFLDVREDFPADLRAVNVKKQLRSVAVKQFLVDPPGFLKPLARSLSARPGIREWVQKALYLFNTRYGSRPPLRREIRRQLRDELAPEIEKLGRLLERDLSSWLND